MGNGNSTQFQESLKYLLEHNATINTTNDNSCDEQQVVEEEDFWNVFWTYPSTSSINKEDDNHIFSLIREKHVVHLFEKNPSNLQLLIKNAVRQLATCSKGLNATDSGATKKKTDERERYAMIINCSRIISRILPVLFSIRTMDSESFIEKVFWTPVTKRSFQHQGEELEVIPLEESAEELRNDEKTKGTANESDDAREEKEDANGKIKQARLRKQRKRDEEESPALGIVLMEALNHLLFLPNFTISPTTSSSPSTTDRKSDSHTPLYIDDFSPDQIWATGIETKETNQESKDEVSSHSVHVNRKNSNKQMGLNRIEILNCLLACFSHYSPLYHSTSSLSVSTSSMLSPSKKKNKWLNYYTCASNTHAKLLFCSLINTSCSYDPIGWGVPYNHLLFSDYYEGLVDACFQMLCVLLHHVNTLDSTELKLSNVFVEMVKQIKREEEFEFIFKALERLLNNPLLASSTILPNSTKPIFCHREAQFLFYLLIHHNQRFLDYILKMQDINKLAVPILHYIHTSQQPGVATVGTFLMMILSGSRDFAVAMNRPFYPAFNTNLPFFMGNHADFFIMGVYDIITKGFNRGINAKGEELTEWLLSIVSNITPYIKSLSKEASSKLVKLFEKFAKKLANSTRCYVYINHLLNTFNNLIQYQYDGNINLVYAIVEHRESFASLARLQLSKPTSKSHIVPFSERTTLKKSLSAPHVSALSEESFVINRLPLIPCLRLIASITPVLTSICTGSAADEREILIYLKKSTFVGILPLPHPIIVHHYHETQATEEWFDSYLWHIISTRNNVLFTIHRYNNTPNNQDNQATQPNKQIYSGSGDPLNISLADSNDEEVLSSLQLPESSPLMIPHDQ